MLAVAVALIMLELQQNQFSNSIIIITATAYHADRSQNSGIGAITNLIRLSPSPHNKQQFVAIRLFISSFVIELRLVLYAPFFVAEMLQIDNGVQAVHRPQLTCFN